MNRINPNRGVVLSITALMISISLLVAVPSPNPVAAATWAEADTTEQTATLSTPQLIDQALGNGEISADERLLYLTYAVYEYESLPAEFQSNAPWHGTGIVAEIRNAWQSDAVQSSSLSSTMVANEMDRLLAVPAATICDQQDGAYNDSTSATFYINHNEISETFGDGLTLAQYRQALDDTFDVEITDYGWAEPPLCPTGWGGSLSPARQQVPSTDRGYWRRPLRVCDRGWGVWRLDYRRQP